VADVVRRRLRTVVGLTALAELVVFVLVAAWIGLGWTIVATLVTSVLGWVLLASQGRRTLADLRQRARSREAAGRELGDAGLVAVGGLLMVLPGFLGDLVGLLCLLPGTRGLVRAALRRVVLARLPEHLRGPVRVGSTRTAPVDATEPHRPSEPLVIEGEVLRDPDQRR
jgi:UPF0716 protein FxsA